MNMNMNMKNKTKQKKQHYLTSMAHMHKRVIKFSPGLREIQFYQNDNFLCVFLNYPTLFLNRGFAQRDTHYYMRTILTNLLVSYCTAGYGEKERKMLELPIYFMEGFEISTKCVC